jgi:undecaprenyl-diphosphatase
MLKNITIKEITLGIYTMENIKILILSIVQGITELLPISSSGHLILVGDLIDFNISGSVLLLSVLHIGTTLAIIVFNRKILFKNFFTKDKWIFFLKLLISSIPAALTGFLLEDFITSQLHSKLVIAISLIVLGIFFIIIENSKLLTPKDGYKKTEPEDISLGKMFLIGIGQSFALIPGTSRSGITTLTGILLGLEKYSAFNFSFLLGIPVLLGSAGYEIIKSYLSTTEPSLTTAGLSIVKMLPMILVSFIVGYISLLLVKKFKKEKWLTVFGVYRILIGILILLFAI